MTDALRADLDFVRAGSRVSLEISSWANVRLLEPEAMIFAQFGLPYLYVGGLYRPGRVTLRVPESGYWWLMIDLQGVGGSVSVSPANVERRRLIFA